MPPTAMRLPQQPQASAAEKASRWLDAHPLEGTPAPTPREEEPWPRDFK